MVKRKIVLYGAMLGLAFSVAAGPVGAFATEGGVNPAPTSQTETDFTTTVPVTLHKKQFGSTQTEIKNDGNIMSQFATAKGLNGVGFTVYDVTTQYLAALVAYEGLTDAEKALTEDVDYALTEVQNLTAASFTEVTPTATGTTSKVDMNSPATPTDTDDDEDGILELDLPLYSGNATDGYNYAVYLFIESAGENITTAPLAVAFPIEKTGTDKTVHLYPKNVVNARSITLEKVATDDSAAATLAGATFTLQDSNGKYYTGYDDASQTVVWGDSDATPFVIGKDGKVVISGLVSGSYTLKETVVPISGDFEMTVESQTVVFEIDEFGDIVDTDDGLDGLGVVFEDKNAVGEPKDEVDLSHKAAKNTIVVENRKLVDLSFMKIEKGTKNKLTGAEFHITHTKDSKDYLYKKDAPVIGEYDYKWYSEFPDNTTDGTKNTTGYTLITLDGNTKDSVKGLLAGTYWLHEVKAPVGFILPDDAYTKAELFATTEAAGDTPASTIGVDFADSIVNIRKGALPSTGGSGIAIFLVTGAVVMASAVVISRRNRDEAEEI